MLSCFDWLGVGDSIEEGVVEYSSIHLILLFSYQALG